MTRKNISAFAFCAGMIVFTIVEKKIIAMYFGSVHLYLNHYIKSKSITHLAEVDSCIRDTKIICQICLITKISRQAAEIVISPEIICME